MKSASWSTSAQITAEIANLLRCCSDKLEGGMVSILRVVSLTLVSNLLPLTNSPAQEATSQNPNKSVNTVVSDWYTSCTSDSRGGDQLCQLGRSVLLQANGQQVIRMSMNVPAGKKKISVVFQTPLAVLLGPGIEVQVDDNRARNFALTSCDQKGCYANRPISDKELELMIKGANITLKFQDRARDIITTSMSLSGFTDAYNKIKN